MNKYNLFALLPNNTEEQLIENSKNITELMQKFGVVVVAEDKIGKRKLAFPIKKARHAFYTNYILDLENTTKENLDKLWKELRLLPDMLRFDLAKVSNENSNAPKLVYQEEENRERGQYNNNSYNSRNNNNNREREKREPVMVEKVVEKVATETEEVKPIKKENKISMEELDQKLEDILSNENV